MAPKTISSPFCREQISAYIPSPDSDHRTAFFSADRFRYEAEGDLYLCPAGKELRFDRAHSCRSFSAVSCARQRLQSLSASSAKCTTSKQGRSLCRSVDEEVLDRVRSYQVTEPYQKALRKRTVRVEPLFARSAKTGMGCTTFACDGTGHVNCEALLRAAGQNLKRLLKKHGWGRHPFPVEALCAFFLASCRRLTCPCRV